MVVLKKKIFKVKCNQCSVIWKVKVVFVVQCVMFIGKFVLSGCVQGFVYLVSEFEDGEF